MKDEQPLNDIALTRAIEERMLNAWPAVETVIAGEWLLRFANGYSKRSNSAASVTVGADMDAAMLGRHMAQAAAWRIPAAVRITPLCDRSLDARLASRGFVEIDPTFGMARDRIGDVTAHVGADPRVTFAPKPDRNWIVANATSYGGVKSNADLLTAILERIRPQAAFATLVEEDAPVAWGVGVIEGGMIGLQDIVVAPSQRGRGLGRALMRSLLAWGAANGATRAYLHVTASNLAARALYRSLGFFDAYRVAYRIRANP